MKWLRAKILDIITETMNNSREEHILNRVPDSGREVFTPEPVSAPETTNLSDRHEDDAASENLRKTFGRPNDDYSVQRGVDTCSEEKPATT